MLKFVSRFASYNSSFKKDWGGNDQSSSARKVLINQTCYRDNMLMNLSVLKANFKIREQYIVLRNKGLMIIEMIPLTINEIDPTRKVLNPRDKYSVLVNSDALFALIHETNTKFNYKKENDAYEVITSDKTNEWEWTIVKNSNLETKRVITMNKSERFIAKEFLKYSIPYIMGWYSLGDLRIAEQNLVNDTEIKDPFENI